MPPAITITRGENHITSRDDTAVAMAIATANGMKPTAARSGL